MYKVTKTPVFLPSGAVARNVLESSSAGQGETGAKRLALCSLQCLHRKSSLTVMEEYSDRTPVDILRLPMVPIRDVVIFPFTKVKFKIGRPGSVRALEEALATARTILLATPPPQRPRGRAKPRTDLLGRHHRPHTSGPAPGERPDAGHGRGARARHDHPRRE